VSVIFLYRLLLIDGIHRVDPGLIPGIESLTNGDIRKKRKMLKEV
jgi:hypothetical protein